MSARKLIIACVVKQYGSHLYRACVSFDQGNVICLSTHKDEESAAEVVNRFHEACRQGGIKQPEDVSLFIAAADAGLARAA